MKKSLTRLAAAGLLTLSMASPICAAASDFEFQPVAETVKNGSGSEIAVKLVDTRTGKPVEGAVVFRTRLDMSPDGMAAMETTHAPLPSSEPGVYRFKADFSMAGGWALTLEAKVPGEAETVKGSVLFQAKD